MRSRWPAGRARRSSRVKRSGPGGSMVPRAVQHPDCQGRRPAWRRHSPDAARPVRTRPDRQRSAGRPLRHRRGRLRDAVTRPVTALPTSAQTAARAPTATGYATPGSTSPATARSSPGPSSSSPPPSPEPEPTCTNCGPSSCAPPRIRHQLWWRRLLAHRSSRPQSCVRSGTTRRALGRTIILSYRTTKDGLGRSGDPAPARWRSA